MFLAPASLLVMVLLNEAEVPKVVASQSRSRVAASMETSRCPMMLCTEAEPTSRTSSSSSLRES